MESNIAIFLASNKAMEMCNTKTRHLAITLKANEDFTLQEQSIFFLLDMPSSVIIRGRSGYYNSSQENMFNSHEFKGGITIENTSSVTKTIEFLVLSDIPKAKKNSIQQLD